MRAVARRGFSHQSATPAPPVNATRAIDDEQLAVRAVVEPVQPVPGDRLVVVDRAARVAQPPRRGAPHSRAADPVEHEPHFDTRAARVPTSASISMFAASPGLKM